MSRCVSVYACVRAWPTNQWAPAPVLRSQYEEVVSYCAALRRSEGQESIKGTCVQPVHWLSCRRSFYFAACESLDTRGGRICCLTPVSGAIQQWWSGAERCHGCTADGERQREGGWETGEVRARRGTHLISTFLKVRGKSGLPTGLPVTGDVIKLFPFVTETVQQL